jgi:CBS domain containing-hemolysin-like protein
MPIEEVEAVLETPGMAAEAEKRYGTLAGFVMNRLGRVPKAGEEVTWGGYRFVVDTVSQHRVRLVRVESVHTGRGSAPDVPSNGDQDG